MAESSFFLNRKVEVRPDHNGAFDELILLEDGECRIHFEMLDANTLWVGVHPKGEKNSVHVTITAKGALRVDTHKA